MITVQVVDFQIFASPTVVNTTPGVAGTSMITVMPVNGFTGTVSLTTSISPATGLTCTVSPTSITGGSGTSTLSCSGTGGTYTVTVTGTSGSLSHSAMVTVNVQDFTLTASPTSISILQGASGTSSIQVNSLGGFSGTVALTASAPAGVTTTLSPTSITSSGTSTLTIGTTSSTAPGTYTVTVTGTSGSLTHSATVTVTVVQSTPAQSPFFTQGTWNHRFSLSKYSGVQTFKFGFKSNSTTTIYAAVVITGVDGVGVNGFTLTSQVFTLNPNKNISNQSLSQSFDPSQIGETFTFTMVIHWGTTATNDPSQLPFTSTLSNGAPTSGSFTILP
jgi:hypothetical protein